MISARWYSRQAKWVLFVLFLLLANGLPAFVILMTLPDKTDVLFVWTINPVINARLVGAMYGNALLLVLFALFQSTWERVRINMIIITLFSVLATLLTFVYLDPFLAHPWYHLAYWLTNYLVLFFAAPAVFVVQEITNGGRRPVTVPLTCAARLLAGTAMGVCLVTGLGLLFQIERVNQIWPWTMPPLVGGLIGILFITHTAAYAWAIADGDWLRTRPMFWQAPLTGALFMLLPLMHSGDLRAGATAGLLLYYLLTGLMIVTSVMLILSYRPVERELSKNAA